jgi:hypothetical protein
MSILKKELMERESLIDRDKLLWEAIGQALDNVIGLPLIHVIVTSYAISWFKGVLLSTFGERGESPGKFMIPSGIFGYGKEIYVIDTRTVQVFFLVH